MAGVAGDRGSNRGEDPGADDRADSQRRQLHGPERAAHPAADLAVGDALVYGLPGKQLSPEHRIRPAWFVAAIVTE